MTPAANPAMPDPPTPRARPKAAPLSSRKRRQRDLIRAALEAGGGIKEVMAAVNAGEAHARDLAAMFGFRLPAEPPPIAPPADGKASRGKRSRKAGAAATDAGRKAAASAKLSQNQVQGAIKSAKALQKRLGLKPPTREAADAMVEAWKRANPSRLDASGGIIREAPAYAAAIHNGDGIAPPEGGPR